MTQDPLRYFPQIDGRAGVAEQWHIEPIPHPKFDLTCPCCGTGDSRQGTVLLRMWNYFSRGARDANQTRNRRCDVSMKCLVCSHVWVYGLVVPELHYQERAQRRRQWHWRQGARLICEHYGIEIPEGLQAPGK